MTRVYLSESRGAKLFVDINGLEIVFGYEDRIEQPYPIDRFTLTFTRDQFREISDLARQYELGNPLPETAGYLKPETYKKQTHKNSAGS